MTDDTELKKEAPPEADVHRPCFIILSRGKYYITQYLYEYDAAIAQGHQIEGVAAVKAEFEIRVRTGSHRDAVEFEHLDPISFQHTNGNA